MTYWQNTARINFYVGIKICSVGVNFICISKSKLDKLIGLQGISIFFFFFFFKVITNSRGVGSDKNKCDHIMHLI